MSEARFTVLTLEEIRQQYGESTPRRQFLWNRFQAMIRLLVEAGQLRRLYLFGSFVTTKLTPGDLDCLAVMATGFSTAPLTSPLLDVFMHDRCRLCYQADVFWVTEAVGQEQLDAMLDVFSRDRSGRQQSIVEVQL